MSMLSKLLARKHAYQLPGDPATDTYVIPVSGGADSVVLAILMHLLFPSINFRMIFTDTKADEADVYTTLVKLESYLNKQIERIDPKMGLYELVEHYGGFIPSANARFCTRELKLVPFRHWLSKLKQEEGGKIYAFVGIRADESSRIAFSDPAIQTELPYIAMNVVRAEVFATLDEAIGIPSYYRTRSRSGCSVCPFQRKSEQVGLLERDPAAFDQGACFEKIAEADIGRFNNQAINLSKETGFGPNHFSFPLPSSQDAQATGKVKRSKQRMGFQQDIFTSGLWVAVEFLVNKEIEAFGPSGVGEGVWQQSLVTYSNSKAGLQRQLDNHFEHRLHTAEVLGISQENLRTEHRYVMYYLDMPSDQVDVFPLHSGGYTWQEGESYAQIKHLVGWVKRTLHVAGLEQELAAYQKAIASTRDEDHWMWLDETIEALQMGIQRIRDPYGQVVTATYYQPKEIALDDEFDEKHIPCPMCHI